MNIYETIIYCGARKVFRILNLSTGTIYSMEYESESDAKVDIEDGVERAGKIVKYISLDDIRLSVILQAQ